MQVTDWSDYQTFLAIARAGQLSRAALAIGVDPTTMGRRLRRLEARLGTTLFEQSREGQVMTEAGEALLASVEAMAQAAAMISANRDLDNSPRGTLRVSVSEGFGSWFLAPRLPAFAAQNPRLIVDLVANSSYLNLSKREADLGIFLSRPKAGNLVAQKLTDYTLRLYAHPDYLAEHGLPHDVADLAEGHRLVGYIPDLLYAPELGYLDEIHPGLAANVRSSSINAQHRLIANGAGIGVLPCFMGDFDRSLAAVLPAIQIKRSFWLVTHADTQRFAKIEAFASWIKTIVAQQRADLVPVAK